ncbi:MAG TPA: nitronate monooxygenase family protein [Acidimicrobiales bacterium]
MRTRLCELLGIEHPILNAPMAMVAGAPLAAAVSAGGGLGMIGGAFRGVDGLRAEIRAARGLTEQKVGVGFISHRVEAQELADVALDEGIAVVAHSFADPTPFVGPAHDAGAVVLCQVRTVAEAERAAAAGVDAIVAQGTEAGGHTGRVSTLPLVPAVVDAVSPLPVVAAGGIGDARGIAAALMLGADGVWIGTRFEATPEAAVSREFRERLVAASTDDTVLTEAFDLAIKADWPDGVAIRALRNAFTDEWHGREAEVRAWSEQRSDEYRSGDYLFSRERGVTPAGESVGVVGTVEPAGDLVRRLVSEAEAILRERPAGLLG